ncbi:MAG: glyoxalase family protein [Puniceicoccaceae bacterium 5H]|nr:MAG: glyoxalase family protein [Puniceicoccaceae bacterium 5H]
MMAAVTGIHHITAMTANPQVNVREYRDFWGLRLIKQTVNFDDPSTYHLYYGDYTGAPGTALTYFPWPNLRPRQPGNHEASAVAYHVAADALDAWEARLRQAERPVKQLDRFGDAVLVSQDVDGYPVELVGKAADSPELQPWPQSPIPAVEQLLGFHSITLRVPRVEATARVLDLMGFERGPTEGKRHRFLASGHGHGSVVDVLEDRKALPTKPGAGSVHHVAFRVPDQEAHDALRERLAQSGLMINGPINRTYFTAAYFREPNGILFEISTDNPGFTVDEKLEELGATLKLPPQFEHHREDIERLLPRVPALQS